MKSQNQKTAIAFFQNEQESINADLDFELVDGLRENTTFKFKAGKSHNKRFVFTLTYMKERVKLSFS